MNMIFFHEASCDIWHRLIIRTQDVSTSRDHAAIDQEPLKPKVLV
jgi:hypothetical protein